MNFKLRARFFDVKLIMVSLIFILVMPVGAFTIGSSNQKFSTKNVIEWYSDTVTSYNPENGYDYPVQEWINAYEARDDMEIYYNQLPNVGIAIFDTGLDPDVWQWIESQGGEIVKYIRPSLSCQSEECLYNYETTNYWEAYDDNGHGSAVAGAIWQVAQTAKYYIFDINDLVNWNLAEEMALKWIVDHPEANIKIFTQSSKATSDTVDIYNIDADYDGIKKQELVDTLNARGVSFFTSGGNEITCPSPCDRYPDKYPEFIPIAGHQIWNPLEEELQTSYGPNIQFTAPSEVDVVGMTQVGDQAGIPVTFSHRKGSSFATPLAAGIAAVVYSAYKYEYGVWPTPAQVFDILETTAEVKFQNGVQHEYLAQKPITDGWVSGESSNNIKERKDYTGWGVIDLHDALMKVTSGVGIGYWDDPNPYQRVSGTFTLDVYAWDGTGINRVRFYRDSRYIGSDYTGTNNHFTLGWNTQFESTGYHSLRAYIYDNAGNYKSITVWVYVSNGGGGCGIFGCF